MDVALLIARLLLALVFVVAGVAKLADQAGLLEPSTGQHLEVLGAHVYDRTWSHTEIHPIYKETFDDGSTNERSQASG